MLPSGAESPARRIVLAGLIGIALSSCGDRREPLRSNVDPAPAQAAALPRETLWIADGSLRRETGVLLAALTEAQAEGLHHDPAPLQIAVAAARGGDRAALDHADQLLSQALVRYADHVTTPARGEPVHYVDEELTPRRLSQRERLEEAAATSSLAGYIAGLRPANPIADQLRAALTTATDPAERATVAANLDRLRVIRPARRFVLVDTASARLWMVEDGRIHGTMKVVVGKPGMETPAMAGLIRFANLNPYWHVPLDLVRDRVKRHVLSEGPSYFRRERLQPVSAYSEAAVTLDPRTIDWRAVARGETEMGLRQLPGPDNMMGAVKFMFPNSLGIYLHDTPGRWAFARADRRISSGCVRLEDAGALYQWLLGTNMPSPDAERPEQRMDLPEPVPVYILHLTTAPDAEGVVRFQPEPAQREVTLSGVADTQVD